MLVFHDHSFSTSGIWNSQEFASSFLCLRNRILFFSSLFLLFSQTAWSLINLGGFCSMFKKRQLATDKTKILFILKIRTRILMIMAMRYSRSVQILCASKKSNNGEIIGGEWDRIRVIQKMLLLTQFVKCIEFSKHSQVDYHYLIFWELICGLSSQGVTGCR